jgi:hypothetical protein
MLHASLYLAESLIGPPAAAPGRPFGLTATPTWPRGPVAARLRQVVQLSSPGAAEPGQPYRVPRSICER